MVCTNFNWAEHRLIKSCRAVKVLAARGLLQFIEK